jgi:hypothetical protein
MEMPFGSQMNYLRKLFHTLLESESRQNEFILEFECCSVLLTCNIDPALLHVLLKFGTNCSMWFFPFEIVTSLLTEEYYVY